MHYIYYNLGMSQHHKMTKLTVKNQYPSVEIMPVQNPTIKEPYGEIINSEAVPIATPPAKVAF